MLCIKCSIAHTHTHTPRQTPPTPRRGSRPRPCTAWTAAPAAQSCGWLVGKLVSLTSPPRKTSIQRGPQHLPHNRSIGWLVPIAMKGGWVVNSDKLPPMHKGRRWGEVGSHNTKCRQSSIRHCAYCELSGQDQGLARFDLPLRWTVNCGMIVHFHLETRNRIRGHLWGWLALICHLC